MLFWGLSPDTSNTGYKSGVGCPITIYTSAMGTPKLVVYNKVTIYFALSTNGLPSLSSASYYLNVNVGADTSSTGTRV